MKWNAPVVDVLLVVACCLARSGWFVTILELRVAIRQLRESTAALRQELHADHADDGRGK